MSYEDKLHIKHWEKASFEERLDALQQLENAYAKQQGRAPCSVKAVKMDHSDCVGAHLNTGGEILINEDYLKDKQLNNLPRETMPYLAADAVIHEGRHDYQYYALDHPEVHGNKEELENWQANVVNYIQPERIPAGYRFQSLEKDAYDFTAKEMDNIYARLEQKYGPQRGYTDYKNMAELNDEKWRIVGEIWLGDDFVNQINNRILEEHREPVYGIKHDSSQAIDPEKEKTQTARELPDNAPSKVLYESYAKQVGNRQGSENLKGNDNEIIKEMVRDGRSMQRIKDSMRHSPALKGKSGAERTTQVHKMVQDVLKSPKLKECLQSREKSQER